MVDLEVSSERELLLTTLEESGLESHGSQPLSILLDHVSDRESMMPMLMITSISQTESSSIATKIDAYLNP